MNDQEQLLGYDAREMWVNGASMWNQQRRETYLLPTDVAKALFPDTMVWPSVFDENETA